MSQAITVAAFVFALFVQLGLVAFMYGRLSERVDTLKAAVEKKASDERVTVVETNVDKLSQLFQKFLESIDEKLEKARQTTIQDDHRLLGAIQDLSTYMESSINWIGESFGRVGATLSEHDRVIRKMVKMTGVSDDRIPAVTGSVTDTGRHKAITPPPRPAVGGYRAPPGPARDPRTE